MNIEGSLNRAGTAYQICPNICHAGDAEGEKAAIGVKGQGGFSLMVACLVVGEKALGVGRYPFHRSADTLRRPQNQCLLGIGVVLGAKAAANIRSDEPHGRGRHSQSPGNVVAVDMKILARHMQRIPAMA